jgi:hypothetical protein
MLIRHLTVVEACALFVKMSILQPLLLLLQQHACLPLVHQLHLARGSSWCCCCSPLHHALDGIMQLAALSRELILLTFWVYRWNTRSVAGWQQV